MRRMIEIAAKGYCTSEAASAHDRLQYWTSKPCVSRGTSQPPDD